MMLLECNVERLLLCVCSLEKVLDAASKQYELSILKIHL